MTIDEIIYFFKHQTESQACEKEMLLSVDFGANF